MLFSIVIPVYNVAPYLRECVDSVLAQEFTDYEIILVDDGSTDNSPNICDEYAETHTQIKVIHKTNGGLSDARNFGIKEAQGDYLIFLDSDDFWNGKNILFEIYNIIKENNPDLIIHELSSFYDLEKIIPRKFKNEGIQKFSLDFKNDLKELVNNDIYYATACNKIIKTSIIKENNIEFSKGKLHEDVAWCADIIPYVSSYSLYKKPFYYYRKEREGSLTVQIKPKNIIDLIDIISEKENLLSKINGGLSYLSYNYYIYLNNINLLEEEQKQKYLKKLIELDYLLDYYPRNILSFKGKMRLAFYKLLGIKYTGLIEYNIRKFLKK
ncbi:glycosyltransferase family 2 protein [Capnocytophaga sputigena]|uniref:glycosyltransferase family 2 protein n=1 Tax=Capnocytophaga sputigena TaxID=1019 RepID=UPI0028E5A30D|nr:glycosyltransferase family 2 protein [Capnocytophaga sputigena]